MKVFALLVCLVASVSALSPASRRDVFKLATATVTGVVAASPAFAVYQGKPTEKVPEIVAKEKCACT